MILVFGSNILDIFFNTDDVPRADCAIHLDSHDLRPGGKGANQAIAAARAGAEVKFFGAVGHDAHGQYLVDCLKNAGIDTHGITLSDLPTGLATIFVDVRDGTHRAVVSQGANLSVRQAAVPDSLLATASTLLVQGELPAEETSALLKRARRAGLRTILNLAPVHEIDAGALGCVDVFMVNQHEAARFSEMCEIEYDGLDDMVRKLQRAFGFVTVVTLGASGSLVSGGDGIYRIPALGDLVVDTLGAGGAFAGNFAASLDQGDDLMMAMKKASIAAGLTCRAFGAQTALPLAGAVLERLPEIDYAGPF